MNMGGKIRDLRIKKGLTLEELGDKVGVGKSTVRKWENGMIANMRRDKISKIADALNVSPAYLMGWENEIDSPSTFNKFDNVFPIKTHKVPLLGEIACGEPIFCVEDRESYVSCGTDIRADFCLKAKGDSMINARILDGDIVFIKNQQMVENGEIAAVVIDDEALLKRVYYDRKNNMLQLVSENPAYPPKVFTGETLDHIRILGKAIAFQSDVK